MPSAEPPRTRRRRVGVRPLLVALLLGMLPACTPGLSPTPSVPTGMLEVEVIASPICPVEREPPDPDCAPRPVADAPILVQPADGRDIVVGQATTDDAGRATIELPAGDHVVIGGDVDGLMGRPEPARVTIVPGRRSTVTLGYDTGIR